MTFLLDMINGIHKFLGYLDISPKYLNRAYTLLSLIPTAYILRIVYGLYLNQNYLQMALYGIGFCVLLYFWVLNIFYYFFDKIHCVLPVFVLFYKVIVVFFGEDVNKKFASLMSPTTSSVAQINKL